ncbi:MAG TPA: hypothetical protein VI365_18525 [Trebonia sp.]
MLRPVNGRAADYARTGIRAAHRDDSSERPGQLAGLLSWLLPEGADGTVPVILILDDAHELDELTVGFVRELLASELPVLVIATTWPEKMSALDDQPASSTKTTLSITSARRYHLDGDPEDWVPPFVPNLGAVLTS